VVAAAVVLDRADIPDGIADSKTLTRAEREALVDALRLSGAAIGLGAAGLAEIEALNILGASLLAMRRATAALGCRPALALVDGNRAPALACPVRTLIGGDAISVSIGAASIIAKVTRDRLMARLSLRHPGYGWERNAGYGTPEHREALARLGPSPHHRRTFAPVAARAAA
jgi:ribonuclease HII